MNKGIEKRKHPRVDFKSTVHLLLDSHPKSVDEPGEKLTFLSQSSNISISGIYLETEAFFIPGVKVLLEVPLPDENPPIKCFGEVIWVDTEKKDEMDVQKGIGIKFLDIKENDQTRISNFIENNI